MERSIPLSINFVWNKVGGIKSRSKTMLISLENNASDERDRSRICEVFCWVFTVALLSGEIIEAVSF